MASRKKKGTKYREDDVIDAELEDDEDEDGDEETVEVPPLTEEPLRNPEDRALYTACYCALLTAAKMKGGRIDFERIAEEAEDAFYAGVERFGGRSH